MISIWMLCIVLSASDTSVTAHLMDADGSVGSSYLFADRDQPFEMIVTGPQRLIIATRAQLDEGLRQYDVPVWIDDQLHAVFRYRTGVDDARTMHTFLASHRVGHRREGEIQLPAGEHRLRITPPGPLFVRVVADSMLFPRLNAAKALHQISGAHRLPLRDDTSSPLRRIAEQIGDSGVRDGAMAAYGALHDKPETVDWARELRTYAVYRSVLPQVGGDAYRRDQHGFVTGQSLVYTLESSPFVRPGRIQFHMNQFETKKNYPEQVTLRFDGYPDRIVALPAPTDDGRVRLDIDIPAQCAALEIVTNLPVAFEIAYSPSFRLQQPEFTYYAEHLADTPFAWFVDHLDVTDAAVARAVAHAVAHAADTPLQVLAERELQRHVTPLRDLLQNHQPDEETTPVFTSPIALKPLSVKALNDLRIRATEDGDPAEKLAAQRLLTQHTDTEADHLALAEKLFQVGEQTLALRQLRQLADEGSQTALARLDRFDREQRGGRGLVARYARRFMESRQRDDLTRLGAVLTERGSSLASIVDQILGVPSTRKSEPQIPITLVSFPGGVDLQNRNSGRLQQHLDLPAGSRLIFDVDGPVALNLSMRPHHQGEQDAIDGGFRLDVNTGSLWLPFWRNLPSNDLINPSRPNLRPGRRIAQSLQLGSGRHRLTLHADLQPVAVQLQTAPAQTLDYVWQAQLFKAFTQADLDQLPQPQTAEQAVLWLQSAAAFADTRDDLGVQAAAIAVRWPSDERIAQLVDQLTENGVWRRIRTVDQSAGVRTLVDDGASPNFRRRAREALVPHHPGDVLIRGENHTTLNLQTSKGTLPLALVIDGAELVPPNPVQVTLRLDRVKLQTLELRPNQEWARLHLPVTNEARRLRIEVKGAHGHQFLRVRIPADNLRRERRTWFVATKREPVVLRFQEPTWLRVEQRLDGRSQITYRYVLQTPATLQFPATDGPTLFRFAKRQFRAPEPMEPVKLFDPAAWSASVNPPLAESFAVPHLARSFLQPSYASTWSFESSMRNRTLDEDDEGVAVRDRYRQGLLTWRGQILPGFSRAQMRYRNRSDENDTFGFSFNHSYLDNRDQLWQAWLTTYRQEAQGVDETPWTATLRVRWSRLFSLRDNLGHRPEIDVFGRHLSLDREPLGLAAPLDLDVYTDYKRTHRAGLRLRDTLHWRPFDDTWLRTALRMDLNEDFASLDRVSLDLAWSQLLGPVQLTVGSSARRYLADDDRRRDNDFYRHHVEASWSRQRRQAQRWELRLRYQVDNQNRDDWSFGVGYVFGDHGDFANYAPREVLFRNLKNQRHLFEGGDL